MNSNLKNFFGSISQHQHYKKYGKNRHNKFKFSYFTAQTTEKKERFTYFKPADFNDNKSCTITWFLYQNI